MTNFSRLSLHRYNAKTGRWGPHNQADAQLMDLLDNRSQQTRQPASSAMPSSGQLFDVLVLLAGVIRFLQPVVSAKVFFRSSCPAL